MRGAFIVLDVLAWVTAGVVGLAALALSVSPLAAVLPGAPFVLGFVAVFIAAWRSLRASRPMRAAISFAFILGVAPFTYGACPGIGIHGRGMRAADQWLGLIEAGRIDDAYAQAQLRGSRDDFRELVDSTGLVGKHSRTLHRRDDTAALAETVCYRVVLPSNTARYVTVEVRMRYFLPPLVIAMYVEEA